MMRYSRMLSKQPRRRKKYANLVIVLVILGIAAYFVSAGAAGGWLAEHVINPVFNSDPTAVAATQGPPDVPSPSPSGAAQPSETTPTQTPSGDRIEEQITVDSIVLYTLQAGAFADKVNADNAASEIIARGGAGYVLPDNGLYRVFIAAYDSEADAQNVKAELQAQNIPCTIYQLESGSLEFKIGAEKSQIDAIKALFSLVPDTVAAMQQIIYDADMGKAVDTRISTLRTDAHTVAENLKNVVTTNSDAIARILTYIDELCMLLDNIPVSTDVSAVAFSSKLKYNIISIVADYGAFLDDLSSN